MDKPRISYTDFMKRTNPFPQFTLAWAIQFYLNEMAEMGKPVGLSQTYNMQATQRRSIGAKLVKDLQEDDFLDHCKSRKATVCPATINHDLSDIRVVLKYVRGARKDCRNFTAALTELEAVQPLLLKLGLTGKSTPRKRRPTDEEIERLLNYFSMPKGRGKDRSIPMAEIIAFALVSTRRLGEICRITHGDINREKRTYWVRDLKHPTKKKGNDKEFALFDELAEIIRRQPRTGSDDTERVFPYRSRSISASYTKAKKDLGIENLRFHDNRREAISRWMKRLPPHKVRQISGHETTVILERVYDAPKPEDLHQELARQQT